MNRSARSLLRVSVLVPLAAALAAALPAAAQAGAAQDVALPPHAATAPAGRPVPARPVPDPFSSAAAKAADVSAGAVNKILHAADETPQRSRGGHRARPRRCTLDAGKALHKATGAKLPGKTRMTLSFPKPRKAGADCFGAQHFPGRLAVPAPVRSGGEKTGKATRKVAEKVTGKLLQGTRQATGKLKSSQLGPVTKPLAGTPLAGRHAATGRRAAAPQAAHPSAVPYAVPTLDPSPGLPLGRAAALGLPSVPAAFRALEASGLPVPARLVFPPARHGHSVPGQGLPGPARPAHPGHHPGRHAVHGAVPPVARPVPGKDLLNRTHQVAEQLNDRLNSVPKRLDSAVEVLKSRVSETAPTARSAAPGRSAARHRAGLPLDRTLQRLPLLAGLRALPAKGFQGVPAGEVPALPTVI